MRVRGLPPLAPQQHAEQGCAQGQLAPGGRSRRRWRGGGQGSWHDGSIPHPREVPMKRVKSV